MLTFEEFFALVCAMILFYFLGKFETEFVVKDLKSKVRRLTNKCDRLQEKLNRIESEEDWDDCK